MHGTVSVDVVDYDQSRRHMDLSAQSFRDLRSLELLGGEPLYNPESYEVMRRAIEESNNQCVINITSNGTIFPDLNRYPWFRNNPMIVITFSVDAVGPAAEFIRTGTNWSRVENNIRRYQDIGVGVGYHITHSVLNLYELDAIEHWRQQLRLPQCKVATVVSGEPKLTFAILNHEEKQSVCSYLTNGHGQWLVPYIQAAVHEPTHREDFFKFMAHTKRYHGLDWKHHLPDLWQLMAGAD
jgi:sulfatase maturation enzyme AslB (radical SAM superfamily)